MLLLFVLLAMRAEEITTVVVLQLNQMHLIRDK